MRAEQLVAFCTVAHYKSISQAAEALGSSQPGLSRHLANLQDSVGEPLYGRTAYGIELTEAGEALLPYACAVTQTLGQAKHYVQNKHTELEVNLKIGLSYSLTPNILPKVVKRLQTPKIASPKVTKRLKTVGLLSTVI